MKNFLILFIVLAAFVQDVWAEPTESAHFLMNEPVSLMDLGIYKLEKKLNPLDVYHLLKIADWVDDIADHAENVADWLRAMIAK